MSGAEGAERESKNDHGVVYGLVSLLRRVLGSTVIPAPSGVVRSDWHGNIYFQGYKTFLGPGVGPGTIDSVRTPLPYECGDIPPIIFFAGEHTHPVHYGTLHGSRVSGVREADIIIELTKRYGGPPNKAIPCTPCQ